MFRKYAEIGLAMKLETNEVSGGAEKIEQLLADRGITATVVAVHRSQAPNGQPAIRVIASNGDLDCALDEIFEAGVIGADWAPARGSFPVQYGWTPIG